jgi:hypothetical protein
MFDSGEELPPAGAARLAALIEQNHAELKAAECRMLQLACAWADAHYLDSGSDEYQPLIQRGLRLGWRGHPGGVGVLRRRAWRAAGHRHDGGAGVDR